MCVMAVEVSVATISACVGGSSGPFPAGLGCVVWCVVFGAVWVVAAGAIVVVPAHYVGLYFGVVLGKSGDWLWV